jgi:GNAT superfamily N-acetyltransferase
VLKIRATVLLKTFIHHILLRWDKEHPAKAITQSLTAQYNMSMQSSVVEFTTRSLAFLFQLARLNPVEISMLSIRAATIADVPLLRKLINELAAYERESQAVLITEEDLRRDGFGADAKFRAILAEKDGQVAGYAVFFASYSTWTGSGLFLEDLFVRENFRGHGVGKALLFQVAEIARKEGYGTIRLDVLDWNESAIKFYKTFGAEYLQHWRNVEIGEKALARLGSLP